MEVLEAEGPARGVPALWNPRCCAAQGSQQTEASAGDGSWHGGFQLPATQEATGAADNREATAVAGLAGAAPSKLTSSSRKGSPSRRRNSPGRSRERRRRRLSTPRERADSRTSSRPQIRDEHESSIPRAQRRKRVEATPVQAVTIAARRSPPTQEE